MSSLVTKHATRIKYVFAVFGWTFTPSTPDAMPPYVSPWPLGEERAFNFSIASTHPINEKRPYLCNFVGTSAVRSDRYKLTSQFPRDESSWGCILRFRPEGQSHDEMPADEYEKIIGLSDYTLCPSGTNSETHRIWEAISRGSIPIIEHRYNGLNKCPLWLQLLKDQDAPVVWIDSWRDLPKLIEELKQLPASKVWRQRDKLYQWYGMFLGNMQQQFLTAVQDATRSSL